MAFRVVSTGIALLTASALLADAAAQTSLSGVSGPANSVDLRTAPVLQSPAMPPIDFNRPTMPMADDRAARQRGTAKTQETPPDKTGGR